MRYVSTRGQAPAIAFDDAVLAGLAVDGGLYLPETWPRLSPAEWRQLASLDYATLTGHVLALFAEPAIGEAELARLCADAYRGFDHQPDIAPLRRLASDEYLLELFHGPTLAFKDYALQVLGRLFDAVLACRGQRATIVGATSGDTGSAAIAACRDRERIEIFILHPKGRVSEVQRRQMTTVDAANVHNIAIEGTFDDCQDLVKGLFNNPEFRERYNLSAVNSINWARIAIQVAYYVYAALRLGAPDHPVVFSVPTGNFGNVFAAWAAKQMGLPMARLIVGSNENDILTRFFATGRMQIDSVRTTLSPSMDIQISSNFERYLFELFGRDASRLAATMQSFRRDGCFAVDDVELRRARDDFAAYRCDDETTRATIRSVHAEHGILLDPHSAVGLMAARAAEVDPGVPTVTVATAHPAKFPDAVAAATGVRPALPERLADLFERRERYETLPCDSRALETRIATILAAKGQTE